MTIAILFSLQLPILVLWLKLTITVTDELLQQQHTTQPKPTINSQLLPQQLILPPKHITRLPNLLTARPVPILALPDKPPLLGRLKLIKHLVQLTSNRILRRALLILQDTQLRLHLLLHHQLRQIVSCLLIFLPYILSPKISGPILITNCDVGTNNMKLILSRYVKRYQKDKNLQKLC